MPGTLVTKRALDQYGYLDARSYLKTPRIFGFHGVYKRLAIHLGVVDVHLGMGPHAEGLVTAWARGLGLSGAAGARQIIARWSAAIRRSRAEKPPRTRPGWVGEARAELARAFAPSTCKTREKRYLHELLHAADERRLGALPPIWQLQDGFEDEEFTIMHILAATKADRCSPDALHYVQRSSSRALTPHSRRSRPLRLLPISRIVVSLASAARRTVGRVGMRSMGSFRRLAACGLSVSATAVFAAESPPTPNVYYSWALALSRLLEQLVQGIFWAAVGLPFLVVLLSRLAGLEWRWVLWSWKRCLYPALFLLPLVLVVWAIIAVPGPWRAGLASFGVDPRYFNTRDMAISHPPVLGLVGGGRTPLGAQPLLLLGILLPPVLFGCLVAWLIHLIAAKLWSPGARAAAAVR